MPKPSTAHPSPGQSIVVVGVTGSGKTTFSQELGRILDYRVIELDAIHWLPNWQEADWNDMRAQVDALTGKPGWISDGNYSQIRAVLWPKADTVIWLDYSFLLIFARLFRRTFMRAYRKEALWNGNRESFRIMFSRDSVILWLFKTYARRKKEFPLQFAKPEYRHLRVIRFTHPHQAEEWLERLNNQLP